MPDWIAESLSQIAERRNPDGGWPYFNAGNSAIEPTALAVAALHAHDRAPHVQADGLGFVAALQGTEGGIRPQPGQPEPTTLSAVAAIVMSAHESSRAAATRVADYLLSYDPETSPRSEVIDNDTTLRGFAWLPQTFSWVEPTAYGMLLFHRLGRADHPRIAEARRVLLDRPVRTGGWNYGNTAAFGTPLEAEPMPTALALLALWDDTSSDAVRDGVRYLQRYLDHLPSVLSLAWTHTALRARGENAGPPEQFGELLALSPRSAGSPWHRAAALLAVAPLERNPFVIRSAS
ncbi:MAG: hypothetical protein V3T70_02865 [Phycisphaerae bacterium]